MSRIEREKHVIDIMVRYFCRKKHGGKMLCPDCAALLAYSFARLDRCPRMAVKTSCRKCDIHCYSPEMRGRIRELMAFVGPRMLFIHPGMALRHLWDEFGPNR
ncbi:MAG: nitrous oxide-stimulated promoter family protein [Muribaculaceae bacterium]|nr:nitrous oxide-stimulated promoter family protein [Muribaculaceae bacterium]